MTHGQVYFSLFEDVGSALTAGTGVTAAHA